MSTEETTAREIRNTPMPFARPRARSVAPVHRCDGGPTKVIHFVLFNAQDSPPTMSSPNTKSFLVISALGEDKTGIVNDFSRAVLDSGCNVVDSRMTVLGGEFAIILLVSGAWSAIAKLESSLKTLEDRLQLTIISKRTEARQQRINLLPYAVDVVAIDHPGIVYHLANFFSTRGINIEDLVTSTYSAAHTGTPMFSVHITVGIPSDLHIASLREEFMDFCDELNLDAVIEPIKG